MHAANACLNAFFFRAAVIQAWSSQWHVQFMPPLSSPIRIIYSPILHWDRRGESECLSRRGIFRICLTFTNTFPGNGKRLCFCKRHLIFQDNKKEQSYNSKTFFSRLKQIQWTLRRCASRAKHSLEQEGRKPFCQAACKSDMTKQGSYNRQPKRPEESFMQFTYKTNTQVSLYSKAYSYSTGGKRRIYFYKKEVFFSFNDSMKSVLLAAALLNRGSFA